MGFLRNLERRVRHAVQRAAKDVNKAGKKLNREFINAGKDINRFVVKTGKELENGVHDIGDFVEENPLESALIIVTLAGGAYLIIGKNYALKVAVGEWIYTLVGGTKASAGIGTAISTIVPGLTLQNFDDPAQIEENEKADDTVTKQSKGVKLSSLFPERPSTDNALDAVNYVGQVITALDSHPIEKYYPTTLPKDQLTQQEIKALDALMTLDKLAPKNEGISLVEKVGKIAVDQLGKLHPVVRAVLKAVETTELADGTLLGPQHRGRLREQLVKHIDSHNSKRGETSFTGASQEQIEKVLKDAEQQSKQ